MTGSYHVVLESRARKNLAHIDPVVRRRIGAAIDALSTNPRPAGCVPLKGMQDVLRVRVGDYRIVYTLLTDSDMLIVIDIDHRKDIYR